MASSWVAPELADPVGAVEVGEHEDVEQLGPGSGPGGVEALAEFLFDLLQVHAIGTLAPTSDSPWTRRSGFSRLGTGTWWP